MLPLACYDIALCHLLRPDMYTSHNTMHIVQVYMSTPCVSYTQDVTITINSYTILGHYGTLVHDILCRCITYEQYCQMYMCASRVPANRNKHWWTAVPQNASLTQKWPNVGDSLQGDWYICVKYTMSMEQKTKQARS
jgi:hypothetical protein